VLAKSGRRARVLWDPFQIIEEPKSCLQVMEEVHFDVTIMTRVKAVHTLQKAVWRNRRHKVTKDDLSRVKWWLGPFLEVQQSPEARLIEQEPVEDADPFDAAMSKAAVYQLRNRGITMLLYSIAKLTHAKGGWEELLDDVQVQELLQAAFTRTSEVIHKLDSQVRLGRMSPGVSAWNTRLTLATPQAVANALYAASLLPHPEGGLVAGLTLAVDNTAHKMDAQQLSNVLWALSRLGAALPDTALTAVRQLAKREANCADIAQATYALAKLDCVPIEQLKVRATLNCTLAMCNCVPHRSSRSAQHSPARSTPPAPATCPHCPSWNTQRPDLRALCSGACMRSCSKHL
jgi:hypothetical protein